MRDEKRLYIIAGHNGAGKTTFLKMFVKDIRLSYIDVDEIARDIKEDNFNILSLKAGRIAFRKMKDFFKKGRSFAVETTLSGKIWIRFINEFKKRKYKVIIFFIYLNDIREAIERIKERLEKGGHYVSIDIIKRRYLRSISNFWYIYKDISDIWFLVNNSNAIPFVVAYGTGKKELKVVEEEKLEEFIFVAKRRRNEK